MEQLDIDSLPYSLSYHPSFSPNLFSWVFFTLPPSRITRECFPLLSSTIKASGIKKAKSMKCDEGKFCDCFLDDCDCHKTLDDGNQNQTISPDHFGEVMDNRTCVSHRRIACQAYLGSGPKGPMSCKTQGWVSSFRVGPPLPHCWPFRPKIGTLRPEIFPSSP